MPDTDKSLGAPPSIQVEEQDPLIGLDLGGFKVTRLLAAGGMGLVYEAMHQTIGRRAAVKVLKPEEIAERLYLTILSRLPTDADLTVVQQYSKSGATRGRDAWIDLAWALINSPEFLLRH